MEEKTILNILLGGGGFIGTNFTEHNINPNNHNLIIDKTFTKKFDGTDYLQHNLLDDNTNVVNYIKEYIDKFNPAEIRIQIMAAVLGVKDVISTRSYLINEYKLYDNILELLKKIIVKDYKNIKFKIIFYSTSEIYGDIKYMKEDSPIILRNKNSNRQKYALSKIMFESVFKELYEELNTDKNIHFMVVRPFNVIGKYQRQLFVVPKMIHDALINKEIEIHGDGSQRRTFIDVIDFINAIKILFDNMEKLEKNFDTLNFAHLKENYSIKNIANLIRIKLEEYNIDTKISYIDISDEIIGDTNRVPDVQRMYSFYKPEKKLKDTLSEIIQYYIVKWSYER